MIKRRRIKQSLSFQDRVAAFAKGVREQAERLSPGIEREDLLRRARQADIASHLANWVNSPGLQPPK
ncbi:MAG TPA: hypothetical protein VFB28_12015 [Terriglobales bacterium]|nr:hypothetical protein [Terriglobales bacterium]